MKASPSSGDQREPAGVNARHRVAVILLCAGLLAAAGAFAGLNATRSRGARALTVVPTTQASPTITAAPHRPVPVAVRPRPSGYTLVVRMRASFPGYSRPNGPVKVEIGKTWETEPSTLPVIGTAPGGWLHVRLAPRPDESTAWIRASDGLLLRTPYRIVVNLKTTHLELYKLNRLVLDVPAGVGTPETPTPVGDYFVAFFEPPLDPGYGAFIIVTSAHSRAIQSWEGTGDAIIGIHGPIGADAEIGTTGAYISNGCIRLHDSDLLRLEDVPPGTPIDIID